MPTYAEIQQQFRDLQPAVEKRVLELMPDAGCELEIFDERQDGAYWFTYGERRVRMELTVGKQVVVLVYEGERVEPLRRIPGLIEAPQSLGELVVAALTSEV